MSASVAEAAGAAANQRASAPAPSPQPQPRAAALASGHKMSTLSAAELRTGMQQHFRTNGTLQQLKTQLRGMMLTDLLQQPKTARMLVGGAAQSTPPPTQQGRLEDRAEGRSPAGPSAEPAVAAVARSSTDHTLQTWSCGLADALVENHLRRTRRAMSLSIFSTEAEVPPFSTSGAPSEEEQYLAHLFRQAGGDIAGATSPHAEDDFLTPSPSRSVKSVLQRIVEDCITRQGSLQGPAAAVRHLHNCSTQTDASDTTDGATNPLNSLECRLAAVDAKYALTFAQLKRSGATGEQPFFLRAEVERRLAQYKSDMHAQLRSEYEQKYNTFTRVQLQEARDEAEQRYRVLVRNKTEEFNEMERSVVVKLEQERERLKLSWEDVHQQRMEMERRQRDMVRQVAEHEAVVEQQNEELHKVKEACRALRLQCTKWEELCATRLMELDNARSREERRVEDIRRLQAEHSSELRLKEEEVSRLRYRLRLLSREVEVPGTTAAATAAERSANAPQQNVSTAAGDGVRAAASGAAPVDPKQLYGLLLRTEELQRNAVLQQQQQQQRWDAAWVASAATLPQREVAPSQAAAPGVSASPLNSQPAAPHLNTRTDGSIGGANDNGNRVKTSGPSSPLSSATAAASSPASPQTFTAPLITATAPSVIAAADVGSLSSLSEAARPTQTVTSHPASSPSSPAAPPPPASTTSPAIATTQPAPSRQGSASTGATSTTTTTTTATTSGSVHSKGAAKRSKSGSGGSKHTSASAASVHASPAVKASPSTSGSTSLSATPQKPTDTAAAAQSPSAAIHEAQRQTFAEDEETERAAVVKEEDDARAAIAWSEQNKRAIVAETARQATTGDSDSDDGGGGITRPWDRPAMGGGMSHAGAALGGGTLFDDSFTTDDEALIRSTDEDDSDF